MRKLLLLLVIMATTQNGWAAGKYDNPDTIVVARDGTGEFRTVDEAIEVCRAFMDYHKVIFVKNGTYKEKLIIPSWLQNIEICGEDAEKTIITYDDHANIKTADRPKGMGTFRTYTLKIEGNDITLKNITIENNSARLGQAVALHTEGDRLVFVGCRFIGHQDTVYTGVAGTRLYFKDCYICGTTDFIFGPSTFNNCRLIACSNATKVYLGRPWRDYGYTLFMNCELGAHIRPEGWHHWEKHREQTARYLEYNNRGAGANTNQRVSWSHQLTKKEAAKITPQTVFNKNDGWEPTI